MPSVLTTSPTFATVGESAERLQAEGLDLVRCPDPTDDGYPAALARADYLVAGLPAVTAATIAAAPRLRAILKHGAGVDSIDLAAATAAGLPVTSTPAANAQAVAEMALGAIFALSRNVVAGHLSVASGGWDRRRGREIAGSVLGIVGFGQIGRRLARMARGVGMSVIAHDPFPDPAVAADLGVRLAALAEVLREADVLSLHLAGGPATARLVDAAALAAMKPSAMLLNFARGSIVDLDALAGALRDGRLAGAAIDAFPVEPPDTAHPIFAAPNVLFSPHSGADTAQSIERMSAMVVEDLLQIAAGTLPGRTLNARDLAGSRPQGLRPRNRNP